MATPAPLPGPQLELANRWLQAMGMTTRSITGKDANGQDIPVLEIRRGTLAIMAFSPPATEPFLVLRMVANIPAALRATAGRMGEETRRELTQAIYAAMQSNPRSGYQVQPPNAADFTQIEQISLEQVVRLDEDDIATFNRLADSVQELVTGYTKVGREIATYVKVSAGEGTSRMRSETPRDMFR
jgi:hypothetical protein